MIQKEDLQDKSVSALDLSKKTALDIGKSNGDKAFI